MRITQATGKDVLALGQVTFDLNDKGLILLQGENKDDPSANSNGAGKSSLVDLINWVLWGTTARGVSGDEIIRDGAKNASGVVTLEDEITSDKWTVCRTRKKGKEELAVCHEEPAGTWKDVSLGTIKLTQALVEKILGCSEEVFRAAVYVGQEHLVDLPAMTDKKLKELIEEAAGVKILEEAYLLARANLNDVADKLRALNATQQAQQDARKNLVDALDREKTHATRWVDDREASINDKQVKIGKLQIEATKQAALLTGWRPLSHIEDDILTVTGKLSGFTAEQTEEKRLATELTKAERARDLKAAELKRQVTEVQSRRAELVTIESKIGEPCSECGTPMAADHVEHARDAAKGRIARTLATVSTERQAWEALKASAEAAREALDTFRAGMSDPSAVTAELERLRDEQARVVAGRAFWKQCVEDQHELDAEVKKLRAADNPHTAECDKIMDRIVKGDKELLDRGDEIRKVEVQHDNRTMVVEVFSPKGVRAHILDEVTPYLNDRTSTYLGTLSDGRITAVWSTLQTNAKGELKERFAIDVTHADGGKSFASLSGGEKRKVRLACALALQDLVASRAIKPFRLWVGDEIDQALDPSGLERLMMVLQEKAKERGTVVVISHSDLRDWISQTWTVVKESGKSELVV
jgi:DNA repair exonuclease SbcCD ATPase subunit